MLHLTLEVAKPAKPSSWLDTTVPIGGGWASGGTQRMSAEQFWWMIVCFTTLAGHNPVFELREPLSMIAPGLTPCPALTPGYGLVYWGCPVYPPLQGSDCYFDE